MNDNVLLNQEQALGADQILKVTALLYLKEALVAQEYESCQELIDTAKNLGANPGDISALIADYLNTDNPGRQKQAVYVHIKRPRHISRIILNSNIEGGTKGMSYVYH